MSQFFSAVDYEEGSWIFADFGISSQILVTRGCVLILKASAPSSYLWLEIAGEGEDGENEAISRRRPLSVDGTSRSPIMHQN